MRQRAHQMLYSGNLVVLRCNYRAGVKPAIFMYKGGFMKGQFKKGIRQVYKKCNYDIFVMKLDAGTKIIVRKPVQVKS